MISRSDASSTAPSNVTVDGERDLLAINGHHFVLGATVAALGGDIV